MTEAILLCGGLGTRLRAVVSDRPKPMADVGGHPFMAYLCAALKRQGVRRIVFAAGYMGEMIERYFGDGSAFGFEAVYAHEREALGTAGAIRNALPYTEGDSFFVLNADTYYALDYVHMAERMERAAADMLVVTRVVDNISRYGAVRGTDGWLSAWNEKLESTEPGTINGGVYLMTRSLAREIPAGKVSLEQEMIPRWLTEGRRIALEPSPGYFIDIGLPESYAQFQRDVLSGEVGL